MAKRQPVKQTGNKRQNGKFAPGNKLGNRFKPGQSGNPAGRPKSITMSEAHRKQLAKPFPDDPEGRTFAEVIAEKLAMNAATGDVSSAKEIADRTEGKPRQALEIDMSVMDWRAMAEQYGISENEIINEAKLLIESASAASDAESH
jgi:hypothetical protein